MGFRAGGGPHFPGLISRRSLLWLMGQWLWPHVCLLVGCLTRRPVGPALRGYIWIPTGSLDPSLGFPATRLDVRCHSLPIRRIVRSPPPLPLSLLFVEVVSMDKSRGSSSEAVFNGKRQSEGSTEAASDLEYEAALRTKLEAEHASREQVAREHEARVAGPEWLQWEERSHASFAGAAAADSSATLAQANPSPGCGSAVADP